MMRLLWVLLFSTLIVGCADHKTNVHFFEKKKQAKVIQENTDSETVIQNAIMDQDLPKMEQIFQKVKINDFRLFGKLPLEYAITKEKIKSIRYLRKLGADNRLVLIDSLNLEEWMAALPPSKKKLLRAVSIDFEVENLELTRKIKENNFKSLKGLLDEDLDLNAIIEGGETPLTLSIKGSYMMSLRALLMIKDLDVNQKNERFETPLKLARDFKMTAIEAELIKRGAKDE
jgi:hypothetical protein